MKVRLKSKLVQLKYVLKSILLTLTTISFCVFSYAQPTVPPGNGGNGTSPDNTTPLSVPFDAHMNMIFMLVAVLFAIFTLVRIQKQMVHKN